MQREKQKPPDLVCLPGVRDRREIRRSRKGRALQEVGPALHRVEGLPQSRCWSGSGSPGWLAAWELGLFTSWSGGGMGRSSS